MASTMASKNMPTFGTFTFGEVAEPTHVFGAFLSAPSFTFGSGETEVKEEAEPEPFVASVNGLFEGELKKRVALALDEALAEKNAEIESLKHSLSTEKEKFTLHEAKFNKQKAETESLKQKVNDNKTAIARYRNTLAYMDMERTRVVHRIRAPTCGDSGGVTQDGYACQRNSWLDWQGRCKDH